MDFDHSQASDRFIEWVKNTDSETLPEVKKRHENYINYFKLTHQQNRLKTLSFEINLIKSKVDRQY